MTDGAKKPIFQVLHLVLIGLLLVYGWFLLARGDVPRPQLRALVVVMVVAAPARLWTASARSHEKDRRKAERNTAGGSTVA